MNNHPKCIFTFLVLLSTASPAFSQSTEVNEDSGFMRSIRVSREQSYITALGGIGNIEPLLFEGAIIPYFMIHLNQTRWGVDLSPKIVIRMKDERSAPIRTPSYMPKVTFYYNTSKIRNTPTVSNLFGFISWGHHSNGQSDSFYMPDSTTINTKSGDFSTNMIEIGAFFMRNGKSDTYNPVFYKLSFEYHYKQASAVAAKYGNFRINNELNVIAYPIKFPGATQFSKKHIQSVDVQYRMQWIAGNMINASALDWKRVTASVRMSVHPAALDEFTFFAQYYYGQDYYNINFAKTLSVLRFGISADLSGKIGNK